MLRRIVLFFCLLACPAVSWAKTPRPLADVPIQMLSGPKVNLRQYHAKALLMVVFSVTCDDCLRTIQLMSKLQRDYGSYGFQAVAAAGDDGAQFKVGLFIQRYRPSFPVGFLDKNSIIKLCDVPQGTRPFVPIALFIDHANRVRFQFYGNNAFYQQEDHGMRAIIEGLLREAGVKIQFGQIH